MQADLAVLRSQWLNRRIDDKDTIIAEIATWEQLRNAQRAKEA